MDLEEFHQNFRTEIQAVMAERSHSGEGPFPSEELVFAELVMQAVNDAGICDTPTVCHWIGKVSSSNLRISGYSMSEDESRLDLFVTHYFGTETISPLQDSVAMDTATLGYRFLVYAASGKLASKVELSSEIHELVTTISQRWDELDQVRVFVITDGQTKAKNFAKKEVQGKLVGVEAMDIQRLYRHSDGKPRDELAISFEQTIGRPLPCVHVPDPEADYEYALAAIPGEVVRALYERYNSQLLEANVRTFLGAKGKVNNGIAVTLEKEPGRFMAFNNGLVLVCDEAKFTRSDAGDIGISFLKGLQIVNGGQTTSSIYFASRQNRKLDLSRVMVPAKIIVLKDKDDSARDRLISDISRYANSQNAVKSSDLSANRPFHVQLEKLANDTWCPDGTGRWFYERASGAYQVLLLREATTPAQKKKLRDAIPTSRKLSKNDIAKYFEAWRCKPAQVAMAGEKNFAAFMKAMDETPDMVPTPLDARWYREMIAKVIIFKAIQHIISRTESKRIFRQGWVNIATYTVSVLSDRMGDKIDFEQVWLRQGISQPLRDLLWNWAVTVNDAINDFAPGRQVSEVAKHPDLWARVRAAKYMPASADVPEFR